ncbi:RdRP-domain-containing protein [Cucurbitaria berberidis CBS 394.84]|uniref:RNA-dependent RNA polymerase n=1 Tax=Cucurbitaria berberidis CBS 394.84 TaxID=1168544 RepID=A0A9P4L6Y0_9PLEO|nr:RdRP-domain-containing protein [Cucurbitaria berberidis CBS 394.84]KAF1843754.1 RdRP-domain-containing protein [Cucurbitaria berberidis CBS 394.84]
MDICIQNVPKDASHIELQTVLKDELHKLGILAFEVKKCCEFKARPFAILTVANETNGKTFLQHYSGRDNQALTLRGERLKFKLSNKPGQPDPIKIKTLYEKEAAIRTRLSKQAPEQVQRSSQFTLPFQTLMTGVWDYDLVGKLVFDQKFKDTRHGYITFGKAGLVIYLQQGVHEDFSWHCRVDIAYAIVEHVITSFDNGSRGTMTLTLKSPPKFYRIRWTDSTQLYSGKEIPQTARQRLKQNGRTRKLERLCSLRRSNTMGSALCMVYRIAFFDTQTAVCAANITKDVSIPEMHYWKTMVPAYRTGTIEAEFKEVEGMLSKSDCLIPQQFDFRVRFQLMALVLEGIVTPLKMKDMIPHVQEAANEHGSDLTAVRIRHLRQQLPTPAPYTDGGNFSLRKLRGVLMEGDQGGRGRGIVNQDLGKEQRAGNHLALTYKATVTPTGIVLRGPDWSVSNRVLQKYSNYTEYFMKVSFAEEDGSPVFHNTQVSQGQIYDRFRRLLLGGIPVAGRTFEFLGFSQSSLRCHQAWFVAPFQENGNMLHARDIINSLGDFSQIHCIAKCAARIGQAFSNTIFSIPIPITAYVTETANDVERNGRCFSDGCGTISQDLLSKVWKVLPPELKKQRPTVLQIRYRGAKGVLSLDSSLHGEQMHIRRSMTKYTANMGWGDLELCSAAYRPLPVYLNHQSIKILEDLGVPKKNFKSVQNEAIGTLKLITEDPLNAARFLVQSRSTVTAKVPTLLERMHQIGLSFHADRFLTSIVEVTAISKLRELKYRARIPVTQGYLLYGIMDETNTLREGEVYISTQVCDTNGNWSRSTLLKDRVVVMRAPALHPGDIQLVTAVDVPAESPLRALHSCIVFSQQGSRDLPSQLSGGDLDGDLFHIMFDERLVPSFTVPPADYASTPANDLGKSIRVNNIVHFFIEYMHVDPLGQISNKHKITADLKPSGTHDPECIRLAKLASDAVDFRKSGNPVDMGQITRGADNIRPDFMGPESNLVIIKLGAAELEGLEQDDLNEPDFISAPDVKKGRTNYYRSKKILGVLYRSIEERKFFDKMKSDFEAFRNAWGSESLIQKLESYLDRETHGIHWNRYQEFAKQLRECYEENMLEIMDTLRPYRGKPLTELEVFSGNILGKKEHATSRYIREANLEIHERFDRDVSAMIKRIVRGDGPWEGDEDAETLPRAIACFKVALESNGRKGYQNLESWKYVAAAVCLEHLQKYCGGSLNRL